MYIKCNLKLGVRPAAPLTLECVLEEIYKVASFNLKTTPHPTLNRIVFADPRSKPCSSNCLVE